MGDDEPDHDDSPRRSAVGWGGGRAQDYIRSQLMLEPSPNCKRCSDDEDINVKMVEDTTYHPQIFEVVPSWLCPRCGRVIVREGDI